MPQWKGLLYFHIAFLDKTCPILEAMKSRRVSMKPTESSVVDFAVDVVDSEEFGMKQFRARWSGEVLPCKATFAAMTVKRAF